jgi:tetratricopeptide (TPR) repeat protein
MPPSEQFISAFASTVASRFVPPITPHSYIKRIEFASGGGSYNKRGLSLVLANAWEQARAVFRQGLAAEPGNSALHYNLAVALEADGDLAAARHEYEQALLLNPDDKLYRRGFRDIEATIDEDQAVRKQVTPR